MSVSRVTEKVMHGWTGRGWKRRQTSSPRQPFTLQAYWWLVSTYIGAYRTAWRFEQGC